MICPPAPTLWTLSHCSSFPMPRLTEMPSDQHEAEKRGPKTGLSPSRHSTTSSIGKVPSPMRGPYPQTSDDDATSDVGLVDPSSHRKGRRNRGNRGSRSGESSDSSHSTRSSTSSGGKRKKKDGFSSKIQIPEFGGKKATQAMSLMPSDSGLGASLTTGTTMRTLT